MLLKVDVALDYDEQSVAEKIVEQAANGLKDEIREKIRSLAESEFKTLISEQVGVIVEEVFDRGVPQTNTYGEKVGKLRTWTEFAGEQVEKYLSKHVDYQGREESHHRDGSRPRAEFFAKKIAEEVVKEHLDKIKDTVRKQMPDMFKAAISELVEGEKSDKAERRL